MVVHSGQQDDNTMKVAEEKRMKLRESREAIVEFLCLEKISCDMLTSYDLISI